MSFADCTPEEVMRVIIIVALPNKGQSITYMPTSIFKSVAAVVSPIISNLFNQSVREGIFPDILKLAEVFPTHKGGSRASFGNYRPISTLPVLAKIFERMVKERLTSYFESVNVLSTCQFGFRTGFNTDDAVLQFLNEVYTSLDSRNSVLAVYLDLSKAFDTLQPDILIAKLDHYGVRGKALDWLKSYITDRKQFTTVNGTSSETMHIYSGVPQGSVLGPLLLLVYIRRRTFS